MSTHDTASYRLSLSLPVGFLDAGGQRRNDAEVRGATGADELHIGMSRAYQEHPNDMVYRMLRLGRCVTRLGDRSDITLSDVQALHARDLRALDHAVDTLTQRVQPEGSEPDA